MQEPDIFRFVEDSWRPFMEQEFLAPYFMELRSFLQEERKTYGVYPPLINVFNAFNHTPWERVKVVILGQDPYHGPGQANGLCFSVNDGISIPPSLRNIFKELHSDLGIPVAKHGNLKRWARQGVLLLNSTLTVRANQAGSHQKKGWEKLTDQIIRTLSEEKHGLIFLLWGKFAHHKQHLIDNSRHHILLAPHPSPLSASKGFLGCRHFSKTNEILRSMGKQEINWNIE